jgi:hypothetical protein
MRYHIHICTPTNQDIDLTSELERIGTMLYPCVTDTMEAIGPVLADFYETPVTTGVLNVADFKFHRTIEFMVDGRHPHLAVLREFKRSLTGPN